MSIDQMRTEIIKAYSGDTWRKKVLAMHDNQVLAAYFRLKKAGKIK